jgi:hypothetical protein
MTIHPLPRLRRPKGVGKEEFGVNFGRFAPEIDTVPFCPPVRWVWGGRGGLGQKGYHGLMLGYPVGERELGGEGQSYPE